MNIMWLTREMCSRVDMHTDVAAHPGPSPSRRLKPLNRGLGLWFDLWPSDLRVSACRGPAMEHMSTDFGAYSSRSFSF